MPRQLTHQRVETAYRAAVPADHGEHQDRDREAAQDQDHDLNNIGQRNRFQAAIKGIEQRKSGKHRHAREDAEARHRLDRERAAIEHCGQVHSRKQEDPEHSHDRLHARPEPGLEELRHRIDPALQKDRQEESRDNDQHQGGLPLISSDRETDYEALPRLSDDLLG